MSKQYAVLGLGRFGRSVAITLQEMGCEVIAVDNNEENVQDIADHVSYAMKAKVEDEDVLKDIGARNLDGVVVAISEDLGTNVMVTMTMLEMGIGHVVVKGQSESHKRLLMKIGVKEEDIILPEKDGGVRLAKRIMAEKALDWFALSKDFSLMERAVPEKWVGKSLAENDIRKKYSVSIIGIRKGEQVTMNPDPSYVFECGDIVLVVGENKKLEVCL